MAPVMDDPTPTPADSSPETGSSSAPAVPCPPAAPDASLPPSLPRTPTLFLWGPMGVGKSFLAPVVATRLGWASLDLDELIVQRTGRTVAALFASGGESLFRCHERDALTEVFRRILASPESSEQGLVVAVGGGALLPRALRLRALELGTVVTLRAPASTLCRRLIVSRETRPLVEAARRGGEALESVVERLLADRESAYAETHAQIATTRPSSTSAAANRPGEEPTPRDVAELVEEMVRVVAEAPRLVAAGARSYPVTIAGDLSSLDRRLEARAATSVNLVTDTNVASLARTALAPLARWPLPTRSTGAPAPAEVSRWQVIPAGEATKTLATVETILRGWLRDGVDRSALAVGVGGGVVTDIAGFAASTWHRGIAWMAVPTTLLGMVDASVGGKTGVDLGLAKNAVGAFHPPVGVHADVSWLTTESDRSFRSGIAELVKTALVGAPDVFDALAARETSAALLARDPSVLISLVGRAMATKAAIVSRDPEERGERAVLNFGHTVGHALESAGGFERWTHGEAVALGSVIALRLGETLGVTPRALTETVVDLLDTAGLPTAVGPADLEAALPLLGLDKKRRGRDVRFVLVAEPGQPQLVDVPLQELPQLLRNALGFPTFGAP